MHAFAPATRVDRTCNGPACEVACAKGDAFACVHRANELQDRLDTGLDQRISGLLVRACRGGDGQGCLELAVHCHRQRADLECDAFAFELLPEARRDGCGGLGATLCMREARQALFLEGYERATAACMSGVPRSCFLSGYGRAVGYGIGKKDAAAALVYWRYGCTVGDADSCESLAALLRDHSEGLGDPAIAPPPGYEADSAEARAIGLWQRACNADDALACVTLAHRYAAGDGAVSKDPERASALQARACELGLDDRRCR